MGFYKHLRSRSMVVNREPHHPDLYDFIVCTWDYYEFQCPKCGKKDQIQLRRRLDKLPPSSICHKCRMTELDEAEFEAEKRACYKDNQSASNGDLMQAIFGKVDTK